MLLKTEEVSNLSKFKFMNATRKNYSNSFRITAIQDWESVNPDQLLYAYKILFCTISLNTKYFVNQ